MAPNDPKQLALDLIQGIRNELALGTKHFNKAGEELKTVEEIVQCLTEEGKVDLEPSAERKHLFQKSN